MYFLTGWKRARQRLIFRGDLPIAPPRMRESKMADPQYVLEVEPLDLGADVKAVGLDLVEIETREPAHGLDAARLWAATLGALPGTEPWALDFFSHIDRVRDYCRLH